MPSKREQEGQGQRYHGFVATSRLRTKSALPYDNTSITHDVPRIYSYTHSVTHKISGHIYAAFLCKPCFCRKKKILDNSQESDFSDRVSALGNLITGVEEIVAENWKRGTSKDMILMDQLAALNGSLMGLDEALGDSSAQLQSSIDEQGCYLMWR